MLFEGGFSFTNFLMDLLAVFAFVEDEFVRLRARLVQ
jgi:hypothetical protein